ncbi:MAG: hypothetical protein DMG14_30140 [Acidobacteria bacterium]|nr:MAG: hypothetical protein DMG14_30140 [Acidobacteriota bacterium]
MPKSLHLYLIPTRSGRSVLFSRSDDLAAIEVESTDRVRQFIDWLSHRPNRVLAWVGRGIRSLHDYYSKLEDKIDPVERVLKAMASTNRYTVYTHDRETFRLVLSRQRWKHVFWFSMDFVITGVVIIFTPILAPIPGPNLFLYYPFLRLLSHYRAIRGALSGLNSSEIEFKHLPELSSLEENLPGLARFLQRTE